MWFLSLYRKFSFECSLSFHIYSMCFPFVLYRNMIFEFISQKLIVTNILKKFHWHGRLLRFKRTHQPSKELIFLVLYAQWEACKALKEAEETTDLVFEPVSNDFSIWSTKLSTRTKTHNFSEYRNGFLVRNVPQHHLSPT